MLNRVPPPPTGVTVYPVSFVATFVGPFSSDNTTVVALTVVGSGGLLKVTVKPPFFSAAGCTLVARSMFVLDVGVCAMRVMRKVAVVNCEVVGGKVGAAAGVGPAMAAGAPTFAPETLMMYVV